MANILVVYYSRTGSCGRVASHLAEALGADLERIEDHDARAGFAGYARSALEAVAKGLPTIRMPRDPRDYDLVVIGTPVWAGTMSSPVRAYLAAQRGKLQHAAFFAVMGGMNGDATVREMQLACGAPDAPSCVLTQRDVDKDRIGEKCASFVRVLQDGKQARRPRESAA